MRRILYDLTDVVEFIAHNANVTGIQRVQLDVFASLRDRADIEVIPVYFSSLGRRYFRFDIDRILNFDHRYARRLQPNLGYRALNELYRRGRRLFGAVKLRQGDTIYIGGAGWSTPQRRKYFLSKQSELALRLVWMFYDLIPISKPEFVPATAVDEYRSWLDDALSQPSTFLCISDYSRRSLVAYAAAQGKEVHAITTPLAHEFSNKDPAIRSELAYLKQEKFVLTVGSVEIRKNHLQLARIWEKLYREMGHQTPILVMVGKWGWLVSRLQQFLHGTTHLYGQIIHIVDAKDSELAFLYKHCSFTVFPSVYEGWGLPIGESLWMGKHCICYDVTSHSEAGGKFATYCDPNDALALERAVRKAIAEGFSTPLPDRSKLRTWKMVAEDIAHALVGTNRPIDYAAMATYPLAANIDTRLKIPPVPMTAEDRILAAKYSD